MNLDYSSFDEPIDKQEIRRRLLSAGKPYSLLAIIYLFLVLAAAAFVTSQSVKNNPSLDYAYLLIFFAMLALPLTVVSIVMWTWAFREATAQIRMERVAQRNGLAYYAGKQRQRRSWQFIGGQDIVPNNFLWLLWGGRRQFCEMGNLRYAVGLGRRRMRRNYFFLRMRLQNSYPYMRMQAKIPSLDAYGYYVNAKNASLLKSSIAPDCRYEFCTSQGNEQTAASVFTAEVARQLQGQNQSYTVEVCDNDLYVCIDTPAAVSDPRPILTALDAGAKIFGRTLSFSDNQDPPVTEASAVETVEKASASPELVSYILLILVSIAIGVVLVVFAHS